MPTILRRSAALPDRIGLTWDEKWLGPDGGLIYCWERGREMRDRNERFPPDCLNPPAPRAARGELPRLPWKGGADDDNAETGPRKRKGVFQYLSMWQGLRGEDLDIDLDGGQAIVCTRTGSKTTFWPIAADDEVGDGFGLKEEAP